VAGTVLSPANAPFIYKGVVVVGALVFLHFANRSVYRERAEKADELRVVREKAQQHLDEMRFSFDQATLVSYDSLGIKLEILLAQPGLKRNALRLADEILRSALAPEFQRALGGQGETEAERQERSRINMLRMKESAENYRGKFADRVKELRQRFAAEGLTDEVLDQFIDHGRLELFNWANVIARRLWFLANELPNNGAD
jgi:hypothetical protein